MSDLQKFKSKIVSGLGSNGIKSSTKGTTPAKNGSGKVPDGKGSPKGAGGNPTSSGGGVKKVISAANRFILENFVAPVAVGYVLNAITGQQRLAHPQGSQSNPDGTVTYPNGSVAKPDNTITHQDGSVTEADGQTVTYPDGRVFNLKSGLMTFADGTTAQGVKQGEDWMFPAE